LTTLTDDLPDPDHFRILPIDKQEEVYNRGRAQHTNDPARVLQLQIMEVLMSKSREKELLKSEIKKERLTKEKELLKSEKERLTKEKELLKSEKERLTKEKELLKREKERLTKEKELLEREKERLTKEEERLTRELADRSHHWE
jgi:hypothetical protein